MASPKPSPGNLSQTTAGDISEPDTPSAAACCGCDAETVEQLERSTLRILLSINASMFFVEILAGWWSDSIGLLADSLDMFADAVVYASALIAVGRASEIKRRAAIGSGIVQITLGLGIVLEALRRFVFGSDPLSTIMLTIGLIALAANMICLLLIAKHRDGEIHMRASWIFSTNDVIANLGLIVSALLVMWFQSRIPDLIVGIVVATFVIGGGLRILRESRLPACDST